MARKKKNGDNGEKKKGGGKLLSVLIVLLILFIWVITFAFLIKMDVGNLGTSLRPMLKDLPVLQHLLPSVSAEQEAWEENYPYSNMQEAVARILELERQVDELTTENTNYEIRISDLQAEVLRLKVFEDEQEAFAKRVKEFDRMVVLNDKAPDLEEYRKFYEEINPETAEELYRQVLELLQYEEAIRVEADRLTEMKPSNAAAILEEMTGSMELIASYLLCMKTSESAAIVEKMDPLFAARVMQKIADMNEEKMNAIQSLLAQ
ncbi:MAG: hypothetical protein IJY09_11525 [Lachnospiraceae bacterium]|nr:hypothetical protein [Lachnospiraceae bacterium]